MRKKIIYGAPCIGKTSARRSGKFKMKDFDDDYKPEMHMYMERAWRSMQDLSNQDPEEPTHKWLKREKPQVYENVFKRVYTKAATDALFEGHTLFISDMIVLRKWPHTIDLIINISKELFMERMIQREDPCAKPRLWKAQVDKAIDDVRQSDLDVPIIRIDEYLSDRINLLKY
jgi:hypothetical protein